MNRALIRNLVRGASARTRFVLWAVVMAAPARVGSQQLDVAAVDRYVGTVMAEWKVPGLSIGIVRDAR